MLMQFHALYWGQKVLLPWQGHPRSWKYLGCKTFCHHQQPSCVMLLEFSSIQVQYLNRALPTKSKEDCSELGTACKEFTILCRGTMEWRVDGNESESSNQPAHGSGFELLSVKRKAWEYNFLTKISHNNKVSSLLAKPQ